MIRNGQYVAEHLFATDDSGIDSKNIQPNGVDLTVSEIYEISGIANFTVSSYQKPSRKEVEPSDEIEGDGEFYELYPGRYIVVYGEEVAIPEGHVGLVIPRSRYMRSGMHITSAVWDQGYEGRGKGLLQIPSGVRANIERGSGIAQMVFIEADGAEEQYDGSHQGERL